MRHTVRLVVGMMVCCMILAAGAGLCDQAVNMATAQVARAAGSVSAADLQGCVPQGWVITDMLPCQLDGMGPQELAVVMCAVDASQPDGEWWLRYGGPSKVVVVNEQAPSAGTLAEFTFRGCAPPANPNTGVAAPLFTDDLNGDGVVELFVRTREYAGGSGGWVHMNMIKWDRAAFRHAGVFGVAELGGIYFLDVHRTTPGREVILLHALWGADEAHFAPHRYRSQTFGWANDYYVLVGDFDTTGRYSNPDAALANLRKYLWGN